MIEPEFSRLIDLRQVNDQPLVLEPDETEKRRLSGRFGITAIDTMRAQVKLAMAGEEASARAADAPLQALRCGVPPCVANW